MLKSLFVVLTAVAVGTTGCTEKDNAASRVEILPSIATRVTGVHFDAGDQIGLTITKGLIPYVENQMMTYNGSAFAAEGLFWYNDLNEKSTLTAYYPYSSSGAPGEFAVATDQTINYLQSDLLGARRVDITPGAAPVGMLFRHLLSEIRILVSNSSDDAVTGITVGGSISVAEVDLASLSVRAQVGQAADIRVNEVTAESAYRVILVPQTATLTITVRMADGKSRSKQLVQATLESGKRYDVAVAVTSIDISVSLSGDVEDWGDGGSLEDDAGSDPSPAPDEILEYGGESYPVRTIGGRVWMAANLRYIPSGATLGTGVWYSAGGVLALATQGLLYDYATATGTGRSTAAASVQGICPSGWHIPSLEELTSLRDSNCGSDFFVPAGFWVVQADQNECRPSDTGYLMGSSLDTNGKCHCLTYGKKSPKPTLDVRLVAYGISVRCVKNE